MNTCSSVRLSVRATVRPLDRPPDRLSVRPTIRPSVRPTVRPSVRPSDRPSVRPSVRPTVRPTVRPRVRPSPQQLLITLINGPSCLLAIVYAFKKQLALSYLRWDWSIQGRIELWVPFGYFCNKLALFVKCTIPPQADCLPLAARAWDFRSGLPLFIYCCPLIYCFSDQCFNFENIFGIRFHH